MAGYFFIQSLDTLTETKVAGQFQLMRELVERKHSVQVLLVQNAVFMATPEIACADLDALVAKGVDIYVDNFSLAQRGMDAAKLRSGLRPAAISCVIDAMLDKQKVIWN